MTAKTLSDKIVLVTGASRGIGYQAALEAGKRGAHVIAVARTVGGLEELDDELQQVGSSATLVPLDLRDHDGIDRLGRAIFERWGRLDGLVGNAAILGGLSPVAHFEPKEFDKVVAIDGVSLIVDSTSLMYLQGATIDYVDSLMGGGFRIDNPTAVSSCGCGNSFRTSDSSGGSTGGCGTCSH